MHNRTKDQLVLIGIIALIAGWIALFFFISPEAVVDAIGVHNAYLVVFLLALIGGLSTLTGTSLFAVIATFAAGGALPLMLGICAGIGIFASDSIFFLLATRGSRSITQRKHDIRDMLAKHIQRLPPWALHGGVYLYVGLSPLPNDILMIALALARVRYRTIAPALFAASITIATLTAYLGERFI